MTSVLRLVCWISTRGTNEGVYEMTRTSESVLVSWFQPASFLAAAWKMISSPARKLKGIFVSCDMLMEQEVRSAKLQFSSFMNMPLEAWIEILYSWMGVADIGRCQKRLKSQPWAMARTLTKLASRFYWGRPSVLKDSGGDGILMPQSVRELTVKL